MAELAAKLRKMPDSITVTMTVIEMPEFRFRLWLGTLLIRWGVRITGCRFRVE